MFIFKHIKINSYEIGLRFCEGEFKGLMPAGRYLIFDPLHKVRVEVVSLRDPWLVHEKLYMIVKSGALADRAIVLDLKDYERALVWIDGRFSHILPPGLYAYWTALRDVKVEIVDARKVRFEHKDLPVITRSPMADRLLDIAVVERTSTRCRRAATPSGRTWRRSSSSRKTCARRCSTSPVRRS
jgi:hypothetical protein